MTTHLKYYIVDAFTDKPFGGNPAGVVLPRGAEFPDAGLMEKIAAELRFSETAFVLRHSDSEYTIRYFTPTSEVDLCGHATVACFTLLRDNRLTASQCLCHTLAGDLEVMVDDNVMLQTATPRIVATLSPADTAQAYHALGLDSPSSAASCPLPPAQVVSTGLPDIMLPLPSSEILNSLRPDMDAISALTSRLDAISLHPFALCDSQQSGAEGITAHVRDFAPGCGIPEESATGTANASLAYYLASHRLVAPNARCRFLQGEAMGRPSVITTLADDNGQIWVGGQATIVAEGVLNIED